MISPNFYNDLVALLGDKNVIRDKEYLALAELTNYNTSEKIPLVIRPCNVEELKACILLAKKYKQPVYSVSKGKNWGYGSRVPAKDANVLIELERMNSIIDFDEQLGYITVEPGVTFNQAFDYLREKQSELIISITGGSGDASMMGNALERGIGTGLYADRFNYVCGLEVLLPNGEIISTGFERYGNFKTGKVFRWGEGPYLDGIFSQSNLGIVTKITIWLIRAPEQLSLAFYKINGDEKLGQVVNTIQKMAMDGLVRPTVTIYNDLRILSSIMQFPFNQTSPGELDPKSLMTQIRESSPLGKMVGDWNGEISIRSINEEHANLQCKLIAENLDNLVTDLTFITVPKQEIIDTLQQHSIAAEKNLAQPTLKSFLTKKYLGIPDNSALRQSYWRKRTPVPKDINPDRDKCGIIWISPVVPFTGKDVLNAINIIEKGITKYKFEPSISLQCTTERCINIIASISWDRELPEEDTAATQCYLEVNENLFAHGYFTYRSNTMKMNMPQTNNSYNNFLTTLKQAIDPEHILSPRRYIYE